MAPGRDTAEVVVVGAGPVGLLLAGELRLGGAAVVVLERSRTPGTESRASTLHARTVELLDQRGLLDGLGTPPHEPRGHFAGIPLDLTLPGRFAGQWKVPQTTTAALLERWAVGLGADLRRGWEVVDLVEDGTGARVRADTPDGTRWLRAAHVVACDGEDSTVRALTGVPFPGRDARRELLRADVAGIAVRDRRFERLDHGLAIARRGPGGVTRVMVHERGAAPRPGAPDFARVVDAWKRVTGEDISGGEPLWVDAFGDADRQVGHYRRGRVAFAGDAAHQQMPIGGQALNLGLQDAANLGWKLALEVREPVPGLLDTYHGERHPVGARVLADIRAQAELLLGGPEVEPVRALLGELVGVEAVRARLAGGISGLDVRYDVGPGDHPLLGARLPATALDTADGPVSTEVLLRTGRALFLDFTGDRAAPLFWAVLPWTDRVAVVAARRPTTGPLADVPAALVRPDGYLAWTGGDEAGAVEALRRWSGSPHPVRARQRRGASWTRT